uniref:Protein kinase domain-containing protein n=1 Tax=Panagrolaimus sp. PS1159 TaxID=55785 RepID=A0AC35GJA3_9BILA
MVDIAHIYNIQALKEVCKEYLTKNELAHDNIYPVGAAQVSPKKNPTLQPQQIPHGLPKMCSDTAPLYLSPGQMLNGKFRMIGSGGFGQIYKATDEFLRVPVAIKVIPADHEPEQMVLEKEVLLSLQFKDHIPLMVACGTFNGLMYIVMVILGPNLDELRREFGSFTVSTVLRIGQQAIAGLKAVHDVGYLHRDVKPSNMCIGNEGDYGTIFIIDFGMTRQYRDQSGEIRKERAYAGFRGTMKYVSLTVHDRKEQGPGDDFISLLYTLIELCEGSLPWKYLTTEDKIAQKKRITTFEDMCKLFPLSFKPFYQHLEQLKYPQLPDYNLLTQCLQKALPSNISNESPFDWEI